MPKVALLETIDFSAGAQFTTAGFEVDAIRSGDTEAKLIAKAADSDVLGIRSRPAITSELFEASPGLKAIGCYCIGTDQIDLTSANEHGVAVFNSLYGNSRSVVELTIGNIIAVHRRTGEHNRLMHQGVWSKTEEDSYEVRGKQLGVIGYGSIGSQVAVLAQSLGMKVGYYDPHPRFPPYNQAKRNTDLDELLGISDVVTLHIPGTPETKNMMDANRLAKMKRGASYLINTARGDVVDYDALASMLELGWIKGAAVDVFKPEPSKNGDKFVHPLVGRMDVVLTPHIAGSTVESSANIASDTTSKLLVYLATGNSVGSVNLPEIDLGVVPDGASRILNIHENLPGVDAALTTIIGEAGLNIAAKSLKTREGLGYVAIDVEGPLSEDLRNALEEVRHTTRLRVITA